MAQIQIDCPEDLAAEKSPAVLAQMAQESFLVRLYQLGLVSSGRAAEVLHVSRREFLDLLSAHGVSLFDDDTDIEAEARCGR
jgi:predicted HTH domain antitoxin